jgi:hypothetical protein
MGAVTPEQTPMICFPFSEETIWGMTAETCNKVWDPGMSDMTHINRLHVSYTGMSLPCQDD